MVQLRYLLEISSEKTFPRELEERINIYFQDSIYSSDTYVRYYPSKPIEGLNEWLSANGLQVNISNDYFYILIRIDW